MRVVCAVIVDGDKVLAAQRPADKSHPLQWEFPGGKIELNESPEQALKREILEELDCEVTVLRNFTQVKTPQIVLDAFFCRLRGQPKPLEHARICWLEVDHLAELDWCPADLEIIRRLRIEFPSLSFEKEL